MVIDEGNHFCRISIDHGAHLCTPFDKFLMDIGLSVTFNQLTENKQMLMEPFRRSAFQSIHLSIGSLKFNFDPLIVQLSIVNMFKMNHKHKKNQ